MKLFLCLSCKRLNIFDPKSIAGRCIENYRGLGMKTDYSKVEAAQKKQPIPEWEEA